MPRYTRIRYRGFEPSGRPVEREASGFHARVVQHEIDHLDGVLFPMRMTDLTLLAFNEEMRHFVAAEAAETGRSGAHAMDSGSTQRPGCSTWNRALLTNGGRTASPSTSRRFRSATTT